MQKSCKSNKCISDVRSESAECLDINKWDQSLPTISISTRPQHWPSIFESSRPAGMCLSLCDLDVCSELSLCTVFVEVMFVTETSTSHQCILPHCPVQLVNIFMLLDYVFISAVLLYTSMAYVWPQFSVIWTPQYPFTVSSIDLSLTEILYICGFGHQCIPRMTPLMSVFLPSLLRRVWVMNRQWTVARTAQPPTCTFEQPSS